jgi:regulator of replication initiation timing
MDMMAGDVSSIKCDKTLFTELQELDSHTPFKITEESEEDAEIQAKLDANRALEMELRKIRDELTRERGRKDQGRSCCGLFR